MPQRAVTTPARQGRGKRKSAGGGLAPGRPADIKGVDLPLPHERDQALGQVASVPDPIMRQAKRDLDAGLVDTDMRAVPGLDAGHRRNLVPTPMPSTEPPTSKPVRRR